MRKSLKPMILIISPIMDIVLLLKERVLPVRLAIKGLPLSQLSPIRLLLLKSCEFSKGCNEATAGELSPSRNCTD